MRQAQLRGAFIASVLLAMLCGLFSAGCGGSGGPQRAAVSGNVTLDGSPIPEGSINFYPTGASKGPSAGGEIHDGTYALAARQGPVVGACRVEIRATRKTGQKTSFGTKVADVVHQYVPAKYNTQSELTAEVAADGPNQFDFSLSSR